MIAQMTTPAIAIEVWIRRFSQSLPLIFDLYIRTHLRLMSPDPLPF